MIKISRTHSEIKQDGMTVTVKDNVRVTVNGFNINKNDVDFLKRKYNCNVSNLESGLCFGYRCEGKAKCCPEDTFDMNTGKSIAGRRCWRKVKSKASRIIADIISRSMRKTYEMARFIPDTNFHRNNE